MRPPAGDRRRRPRARWLAAATAACALAAAAAAAAATAQTAGTVAVRDPVDTAGGFDLTRVQLGRAPDGRLRAALTLAAPWRMRDLPADDGPPGSLCLRMWTVTRRPGTFPDHLLCVTADKGGRHMRGELLAERDGALSASPRPRSRARACGRSSRASAKRDRAAGEHPVRGRGDAARLRRARPAWTPRQTRPGSPR